MRIQLVKAPMDSPTSLVDRWYMPVDLLSVGSSAVAAGGCEVEIIDGNLIPLHDILERIDESSELVGLSYTILAVESAGRIAAHAKRVGATVIVGGQAATGNAAVLARHASVDAVVLGDGEPAIREIVATGSVDPRKWAAVPNLLMELDGRRVETRKEQIEVAGVCRVDRTLGGLVPEHYISQYPGSNTMKNIECRRPTNIYTRKGCPRKCSFCARIDKDRWRSRSVDLVADEIEFLMDAYGIDYILDMSDTWIEKHWVEEYRSCFRRRLAKRDFRMHVFADVRDITEHSVDLLKEVHVDQALLGVESGSPRILRQNGKPYSRERIVRAVDLLTSRGIGIYASFVIGLVGEDEDSVFETLQLIEHIRSYPGVRCYVNVIIPLPGSPLWSPFVAELGAEPGWLQDPFAYDLTLARRAFLRRWTKTDLSFLEGARNAALKENGLEVLEYAR